MRMKVLVTGGAGFIGSHLVDKLLELKNSVTVFDNLSAGSMSNIEIWKDHESFEFIKGDITEPLAIQKALKGSEVVYHLAANPEVRSWLASPEDHFKQNVQGTFNILEGIRKSEVTQMLLFTSTSTVYGEANVIPTPETYAPLKPISHYGASKLAAEAIISSYSFMYGFKGVIFRLANTIGIRSNHGVIYDFVQKLHKDPIKLEVLGDGTQSKSYLYVTDCVEAMIYAAEKIKQKVSIFNVGSEDRVSVLEIAKIVMDEMGLKNTKIQLTGGVDDGRGWKGDVKVMQLDMTKIKKLGWRPKMYSSEAVRETAKHLGKI
jgi:UDP-glucose 4-epimerase